jgi:hypothetical protein
VDLVPTFSFGEYSVFDQVANPAGKGCQMRFTALIWGKSKKTKNYRQIGKLETVFKLKIKFN